MGASGGSSSGSNSGSSSFTSNPINLQLPQYTGFADQLQGALGQTIPGLQGMNTGGTNGVGSPAVSPYYVYDPATGTNVQSNSTSNPLTVQPTSTETGDLTTSNNLVTGKTAGQGNALLNTAGGTITNMLDPGYAANLATGPTTGAVVDAAIKPLQNTFTQTTMPDLTAKFTAGGQRTSNFGSSAFDRAANEAQNNLLGQEGKVSSGIVGDAFQTGLKNQSSAITQAGTLGTDEINNVLADLKSQSLPRTVSQYGVDQGVKLYQDSVTSLLKALGLESTTSQPVVGYNSSGSGISSGSSSSKNGGVSTGNKLFYWLRRLKTTT